MCVLVQEMDVVQEMQLVSVLDMAALKAEVTKLRPRWCTNMLRGFRGGVQLITQYNARTAEARARPAQRFKQFFSDLITTSKPRGHSTRIMFLTDACVHSPHSSLLPNPCSLACTCNAVCVCVVSCVVRVVCACACRDNSQMAGRKNISWALLKNAWRRARFIPPSSVSASTLA
jgi:hypothetical protein